MPTVKQRQKKYNDVVGVIPAAGTASRLGLLPCSKELLPVGFSRDHTGQLLQPKAVGHYLLERMHKAHVSKVYIILRKGKWDIPAYFGDGKRIGASLAYLMMDLPYGVPYTINQAFHFIKDSMIIFGFPDIIFQPQNAYLQLLKKQKESKSDVVLGLFLAHPKHKGDMVTLGQNGMIESIQVNPGPLCTGHTWIIAAWAPRFTHFLNEYIAFHQNSQRENQIDASNFNELFMGDIFQAALEIGLSVKTVYFSKGSFLDIGHPANLAGIFRTNSITLK